MARLQSGQCTTQHPHHSRSLLGVLHMPWNRKQRVRSRSFWKGESNVRYQRKVTRAQLLLLLAVFADNRAVAKVREDDSVLTTVVVNSRRSMWLRNHSRGADVRSQANQGICSLHALCLPSRGLQRRARLDDYWFLLGHIVLGLVCAGLDVKKA